MTGLGHSHGYVVEAADGEVGVVETPLFPQYSEEPDFLVIRLAGNEERFAAVPAPLVASVVADDRTVSLNASRDEILKLPEHIPIEL